MTKNTINVAVVGLGFGADFVPLYLAHPGVGEVAIVEPSDQRREEVGNRFGITARFTHYDDVLADDRWDAVHIAAPVAYHADYAVAALEAGKDCACAVPMATELADIDAVIEAQRASGKNYMMMETTVFGRDYRAIRKLYQAGALGELSMYRGCHIQNLEAYPRYWQGFPPMKYATHALSPILHLTGSTVEEVVAFGSGRLQPHQRGDYDNPFPVEMGLFTLDGSDIVANITMSFFQSARAYQEGFSVYGSRASVEWPDLEGHPLRMFQMDAFDPAAPTTQRGRRSTFDILGPDDGVDELPVELVRFVHDFPLTPVDGGVPLRRKAEHGGSHPHLVHEFVSSVIEGRSPEIDVHRSAAWTAPGICAHDSAMNNGAPVAVPRYGEIKRPRFRVRSRR